MREKRPYRPAYTLKRFRFALMGLRHALGDASFVLQLALAGPLALFIWSLWPIPYVYPAIVAAAWALVLITELQNSALEEALDGLHPGDHEHIRRSKDMAAASSLIAGGLLLGVVVAILLAAH